MPPAKITSFFKKIDHEELQEQRARIAADDRHQIALDQAKAYKSEEARIAAHRAKATERQRKHREKVYQKQKDLGLRGSNGKLVERQSVSLRREPRHCRPAGLDNAIAMIKKGRNKGNPRQRAPRRNWQDPAYWPAIDAAGRATQYKAVEIVKLLKKQVGGVKLFGTLDPGTVQKWIDRTQRVRGWKPEILERVQKFGARNVTALRLGHPRALLGYHDLVKRIKADLDVNQKARVMINIPAARSVILGYIQSMAPELLAEKKLKCSLTFVRGLFECEFGWSWRMATRAAHKLPAGWEKLCEDMLLRVVYHMVVNGIPADAIVNGDQMGVSLMPTGNQTWAPKGARQVDKFGKEEKHQFTVMVGTTCTGKMLPVQCIWSGKTSASLPTVTARKDAEKEGHIFMPGGANHWSSWLDNIVIPHLKEVAHERGLKSPVGLVIIDCWKVHRSKEFLEVMKRDYRWIRMCFIPGGCTGKFQANDVGIQRILKHILRSATTEFLIGEVQKQIASGVRTVSLHPDLAKLRDASVEWVTKGYKHFKERPELVRKAWQHCVTGQWNLSQQCLESDAAICTMHERLDEDPSFHLSLTQTGTDHMTEKDLCAEDEIHVTRTDEFDDDIAVTPDQLAHKLGLSAQTPCPDQAYSVEQDEAHNVHLTGGVDDEVVEEEYAPPVEGVDENVVMTDTLPPSTLPETVPCPDQVRIWAVEEKLQELWYLKGEGNYVFDVAGEESCDNFDGTQETRNDFLCMALRFGFNKQEQIGSPKVFLMSDFMEGLNSTPSPLIKWDFGGVEPYEGLPHGFFSISEVWDCLQGLNELRIIRIEIN